MYFFKLRSILEIYFISKKSKSINEVSLKNKQSTSFIFFLFLYFIYNSFSEVYLKHTSIGLQGSEVNHQIYYFSLCFEISAQITFKHKSNIFWYCKLALLVWWYRCVILQFWVKCYSYKICYYDFYALPYLGFCSILICILTNVF